MKKWSKYENIQISYIIPAFGYKKAYLIQRKIREDGKMKFRRVFITKLELGEMLNEEYILK